MESTIYHRLGEGSYRELRQERTRTMTTRTMIGRDHLSVADRLRQQALFDVDGLLRPTERSVVQSYDKFEWGSGQTFAIVPGINFPETRTLARWPTTRAKPRCDGLDWY